VVHRSFLGDQLTYYPRNSTIVYRLVRHTSPDRAEVSLTGQAPSALVLAREIYQVDQPDFIQVRMVRGALNDRNARVMVDLNRKYLDDFRNYRDRAVNVDSFEAGMKTYVFAPADQDPGNPFARVDDALGDQIDPATFPRDFRLVYYRDGVVKRYIVTESGDTVAQLNKPDTARWQKILPEVKDWQPGVVEPLAPFTPAVNQAGSLIPGRLLVLSFAPRVAAQQASPASGSVNSAGTSGLSCLGVPLAVVLAGLASVLRTRLLGPAG
jgi:hypothetical protein